MYRRATGRRAGLIVGMAFVNSPDLELGRFTTDELANAIAFYEDEVGSSGLPLLTASELGNVANGHKLDQRYRRLRRARSIKGRTWGTRLMRIAEQNATPSGAEPRAA